MPTAALLRKRDREMRFGDGVHRRAEDRNVQLDIASDVRACIYLVGKIPLRWGTRRTSSNVKPSRIVSGTMLGCFQDTSGLSGDYNGWTLRHRREFTAITAISSRSRCASTTISASNKRSQPIHERILRPLDEKQPGFRLRPIYVVLWTGFFVSTRQSSPGNYGTRKREFCGFKTQWPSSGKTTIFEGTFCNWSAVKNCIPWPTGTR